MVDWLTFRLTRNSLKRAPQKIPFNMLTGCVLVLSQLKSRAPHSWIYNILPHYRIYDSKLISKKFPKKLKALLVDIQLRTGNFSRFQQSSRALLVDIQLRTGNFLDSQKVPKPYYKIYSLNLKFVLITAQQQLSPMREIKSELLFGSNKLTTKMKINDKKSFNPMLKVK